MMSFRRTLEDLSKGRKIKPPFSLHFMVALHLHNKYLPNRFAGKK